MKYMSLLRTEENSPLGPPPAALMEALGQFGEETTKSGALLEMGGLAPTVTGARVRLAGGKVTVTDGPFTEAKEVIASFAVFEVASLEEAVEMGKRFLEIHRDTWPGWDGEVELRQIFGG
jgi:hypothetical protein